MVWISVRYVEPERGTDFGPKNRTKADFDLKRTEGPNFRKIENMDRTKNHEMLFQISEKWKNIRAKIWSWFLKNSNIWAGPKIDGFRKFSVLFTESR